MKIYSKLELIRLKRGAVAIALLDPDAKNDDGLKKIVQLVNDSDFDAIFVGGSLISDTLGIEYHSVSTDTSVLLFVLAK